MVAEKPISLPASFENAIVNIYRNAFEGEFQVNTQKLFSGIPQAKTYILYDRPISVPG